MKIETLKVTEIVVGERFRVDYGDIENLATSISKYGQLTPIIIDAKNNLVAGGRRLMAFKHIGLLTIDCVRYAEISELQKREIELEENIRRKDFTWQEEAVAKASLHSLKQQLYGEAIKGHGGGWGLVKTSEELRESVGGLAQDLKLAEAFQKYPSLLLEKNKSAAFRKLQILMENDIKEELASRVKIDISTDCIKLGDSTVLLKGVESESITLILTDPPWGVDIETSQGGKTWDSVHTGAQFDDTKYNTMNMLNLVIKECYRVLKPNSHMYMFFGQQMYADVRKILEGVGFFVNPVPLVWNKSSGGQAGTDYQFTQAYETIFFCMKGKKALTTLGIPNVFTVDRVPPSQKIHPTEKPRSLLRVLIEQSSNVGDLVCDPFAGSGSTLLACYECDRKPFGFELNEKHYNSIVVAINEFKTNKLANTDEITLEDINKIVDIANLEKIEL